MSTNNHSRREILAAAAGMSAALIRPDLARTAEIAPTPQPGKDRAALPPPKRYRVGLAAYSFRDFLDKPGKPGKMSLLDLVDLGVRLGLDGIETTSYYFLRDDDEFVYTLKRRAFLAGLGISGTPVGNNFALPPGPKADPQMDLVKKWVDISVKLGSPVIRVFAGRASGDGRDKDFGYLTAALREACAYAASKGIFLAIENHGYLTETADDVLKILDNVKSDWLGANLDTGNFTRNPYEEIAKLAPRAIVTHVKATVAAKGGKGREPTDYVRVVKLLREAGYRGYVTLEYEGADPYKDVPINIRKIQEAAG
jgi:sugar phosphate isomerase/epimerase